MPLDLETWARQLSAGLERAPVAVDGAARTWARAARKRIAAKAPRDTGALRKSITATYTGSRARGEIEVKATDPAAAVLEQGGTVRGRPWLAVPTRDAIRTGRGPRGDGRLVSVTLRDGRIFLGRRSSGRMDLRWRLIRSAQRRARPFMRPILERSSAQLPAAMLDAFDGELP